jgi:hypothetical protein
MPSAIFLKVASTPPLEEGGLFAAQKNLVTAPSVFVLVDAVLHVVPLY